MKYNQKNHYKAVIIGGGPSGASISIFLRQAGVDSILVFDTMSSPEGKLGECLMPKGVRNISSFLGGKIPSIEKHLKVYGIKSLWGGRQVMDRNYFYEACPFGLHLNRKQFETDLQAISEASNVYWKRNWKLVKAEFSGLIWCLTILCGADIIEITADFVVDSTGRKAVFSRNAGAKLMHLDKLVAYSCTIKLDSDFLDEHYTFLEACENGWWYSAPLPDKNIIITYFTDYDIKVEAPRYYRNWLELFNKTRLLSSILHQQDLGNQFGNPQVSVAGTSRLNRFSGKRWLAIGDAACSLDPLSSTGISFAFGSARLASDYIVDCLLHGNESLEGYDQFLSLYLTNFCRELGKEYNKEKFRKISPFWQRRFIK